MFYPTRSAFENCLLAIGNLLGDSGEMDEEETAMSISKSLQACLDILSGYGELLEVVSREPVEALYVRSLNENLPLILIGAFNHCKDSENCYGSYFEDVGGKIVFSSSIEENITSLSQVLESVLTITETVVSLDIKTCVDQWKLYARLYAKHISDLKSITDLSQPLALLTSNVQRILVELTSSQETTEKLQLKLLKMGNFLLKMMVKLCELSECRFREGMKDLVELLLLLHSCTRTHEMNDDLKEEVRRFICVGCAPLLALLLKEEDFFKAYNNIRNNLEELTAVSKVGMVFLNLTIMKSVVERKAPPFWSDVPLIESVTDLYNSCGLMVDANSQFEGNDAYSSMISINAAFMIATTDESSFVKLESFMVSKLLCGEIHTSIFVCDYLCLVGRLTSDTYCLHLATYLCEALNLWPNLSRHRPEYNIIGSLVHRLWNLLSQKSRETLSAKYTPEEAPHVHFWFEGTNRYAQTVLTKCDSFCRNPTVTSFNTLMASPPPLIEYEIDPSDYELVSRTFDFVKNVISFLSHRKNSSNELWCLKVFSYSLKLLPPLLSTSPAELVTEILEKLKNLVNHSEEAVELPVLLFLSNSVKNLGSTSQTNSPLAHALTSLLLKLMESQDRVVASTAFDVWKTLENPQLTETLCVDSNLTERYSVVMNAHQTDNSAAKTSFYQVLTSLPEYEHFCVKRDVESSPVLDVPPAKKFKADPVTDTSDSQFASIVQRLQGDVTLLKSMCTQGAPHQVKVQLEDIIEDLSSIIS
ncbi:hypothetical protein GE061_004095 [Apolygus lucorum]|uniref:TTI1 C-terminal TPR domain-containing protein n=1 Tax=Apolygus lucorum TaxID=248454 RepID=A0A8S9WXP5_APOLU|nr:hypothetical protein GE061_004095 [Apolygus lucorum]